MEAVETLVGSSSRPIVGYAVASAAPPPAKTDEEYEREQHRKALWLIYWVLDDPELMARRRGTRSR
jgi:hypothetical protein